MVYKEHLWSYFPSHSRNIRPQAYSELSQLFTVSKQIHAEFSPLLFRHAVFEDQLGFERDVTSRVPTATKLAKIRKAHPEFKADINLDVRNLVAFLYQHKHGQGRFPPSFAFMRVWRRNYSCCRLPSFVHVNTNEVKNARRVDLRQTTITDLDGQETKAFTISKGTGKWKVSTGHYAEERPWGPGGQGADQWIVEAYDRSWSFVVIREANYIVRLDGNIGCLTQLWEEREEYTEQDEYLHQMLTKRKMPKERWTGQYGIDLFGGLDPRD